MSTTITEAFIREYVADVHLEFQRMGGFLRPTVRTKTNVLGKSTTFQKIGRGTATTKARHGVVPSMNQDHTAVECTLQDFYAADDVDKLDEAKTNIDERMAIAKSGAWALGRKADELIITELDNTTQSAVTFSGSSNSACRNSLIQIIEALNANDVPDDGQRYVLLTPRAWALAMCAKEFNSADFVAADGMEFNKGMSAQRWKDFMGAKWRMHTGLPGVGTASAKGFAYHKTAVGFATGAHAGNVAANEAVAADIWWNGEKQAHRITHSMSGGAKLIDDLGVIEITINDTTALPTS